VTARALTKSEHDLLTALRELVDAMKATARSLSINEFMALYRAEEILKGRKND